MIPAVPSNAVYFNTFTTSTGSCTYNDPCVCVDVPSPPSPPALPPRSYVIRESGTCTEYIQSNEECAAAAVALSLAAYSNGAYNYGNGSPKGCKTQPGR